MRARVHAGLIGGRGMCNQECLFCLAAAVAAVSNIADQTNDSLKDGVSVWGRGGDHMIHRGSQTGGSLFSLFDQSGFPATINKEHDSHPGFPPSPARPASPRGWGHLWWGHSVPPHTPPHCT